MIADTFRGKDSTGIFAVPKTLSEPVEVYKRALTAYDFIETNQYSRFKARFKDLKFIAGHNRASTRGASNDANAHPFQHGNITMIHNGTLTGHNALIKGSETFTVDSEALCYAFDEQGAEEVIPKINGAFALIWHNADDDSINFIRNDARPFYLAKVKNENAVIGASEVKMLEWIADRNDIEHEAPFQPAAGVLMSFTDTFNKPNRQVKLALRPPPAPARSTYYYGNSAWDDDESWGMNKKSSNASRRKSQQSHTRFTLAQTNFKKSLEIVNDQEIVFTLDKVILYNSSLSTTGKLFGTYTSKDGNSYPVRNYTVPVKDLKGFKIGDKLKGKVYEAFRNSENHHHSQQPFYISVKGVQKTTSIIKHKSLPNMVDTNPIIVGGDLNKYYGPQGHKITKVKFDKLTKEGCVVCSANVFAHDHKNTLWTSANQPICKECSTTAKGLEHASSHYAVLSA